MTCDWSRLEATPIHVVLSCLLGLFKDANLMSTLLKYRFQHLIERPSFGKCTLVSGFCVGGFMAKVPHARHLMFVLPHPKRDMTIDRVENLCAIRA
jgi:hypothetical protein